MTPDAHQSAEAAVASRSDTFSYVLRLADDALIYAQRLGEWIAAAPQLEEDVALGNLALDQLGQARALLAYAGELEGAGRDADALAFFRDERDFTNACLFELGNGDFGQTVARMLLVASYQRHLYAALADSADSTLAAIAAKVVKEVAYHFDHAVQWTLRLGDGTAESHHRAQAGFDALWPYVEELFESDRVTVELAQAGVAVDPADLREPVHTDLAGVLAEATLEIPSTAVQHSGGRRGLHTEQFGYLLAEMQYLARSHPGASW